MTLEAEQLVERRLPLPSTREVAAGAAAPAPPRVQPGTPEESRRPGLRAAARAYVRELAPSRVTGDEPFGPVLGLGIENLLKGFAASVLSVAYVRIVSDLGVSYATLSSLAVFSTVLGVAFGLAIAYLSDRIPRLVVIGIGVVLFAASTAYVGLAPSVFAFAVAMLGQQVFGATTDTAPELSLLSDYYPPDVRGRVFAFKSSIGLIGSTVLVLVSGLLVQVYGWQTALVVTGLLSLLGLAAIGVLKEPSRGRFDRLRLGLQEQPPKRPAPSFSESLRIVRSVRTLRRICLAQAFSSASGVVLVPLLLVLVGRSVGLNALAIALIIVGGRITGLLGILVGGAMADRVLRDDPGKIMAIIGWVNVANLAAVVVFGYTTSPYVLVPLSLVQGFTSALPSIGRDVLLSRVTPARVRAFGVQIPQLYGAFGMFITLPFAVSLYGGSVATLLTVSCAISLIGALFYLTASEDVGKDMTAAVMAAKAEEAVIGDGARRLLVCRGVEVTYDGTQVLFGVDFDVEEGELVALLGTNGAGKSTLLRAISGVSDPSGGAVFFDGRDTTHAPAYELARAGVVQMPGGKGVFPSLTVAENLRIAAWSLDSEAAERVEVVYAFFPQLRERRDTLAGNLSGGEQQMVALGQAMIMKPRLLLIDELSLGLAPAVVEQLLQAVVGLHQAGTTVILVEQSVDLALSVAQRAVFMEKGEIRFDGSAQELRATPSLIRSVYLSGTRAGGRRSTRRQPRPDDDRTVALHASGLCLSYGGIDALTDVSITVRSGEIVGLIGPNGAGKTTLFDALCGFVPTTAGTVEIGGHDASSLGPRDRAALGLARSFQDAKLFPSLTVAENLLLALARHAGIDTNAASSALWLPAARRGEAALRRRADVLLESFGLGDLRHKVPSELSTGTRRILDVALQLASEPEVLLLDEPSAGIAQAEAEELAPLLDRVRRDLGCGLLVIEHDMSLLTTVADRLVGMVLGRTVVEGTVEEVTSDPRMVAAYLGTTDRVLARSGRAPASNGKPT